MWDNYMLMWQMWGTAACTSDPGADSPGHQADHSLVQEMVRLGEINAGVEGALAATRTKKYHHKGAWCGEERLMLIFLRLQLEPGKHDPEMCSDGLKQHG